MAAIDDLIAQISDETLRERIRAEFKRASKQKKFGIVYEEHIPESTLLYEVPIKKGSLVAQRGKEITELFYVESISGDTATCLQKSTKCHVVLPLNTLVVVAQFGEPIYPYLQKLDSVCNAPDSDLWHTLIEADNYHALQLLEYLYSGKIDCIYIDPPYNTGARDWKYNNDYVDSADQYRHSKWLSMMHKRLVLAKKLLNPKKSVLIVTIDEKEYLHLGCLLEEIFPESKIQMISTVINPKGAPRSTYFVRMDEYIFFVFLGEAYPQKLHLNDDFRINASDNRVNKLIRWQGLAKTQYSRAGHPETFYPIYVSKDYSHIVEIGDPIGKGVDRNTIPDKDGCITVWPLNKASGAEAQWSISAPKLRKNLEKGYVRLAGNGTGIYYLTSGVIEQIESGEFEIIGRNSDGSIIVDESAYQYKYVPGTAWRVTAHDATRYGSDLLTKLLPDRNFAFPKSLYAVHDAIKFFVADNPDALVLDFFAGSGTTLHAVNLMNSEDSGHRHCILVTNNEVSEAEAKEMTSRGLHPGDEEWDKLGIARYVTWPRTVCSIEGHDTNGQPLKGNYLGSDSDNPRSMAEGFEANAVFFKLGFLDKTSVALGRQFVKLLPILWLKAGAYGPCPEFDTEEVPSILILPENHLAVLTDEAQYEAFASRVNADDRLETVYIVTDSEPGYREMISGLHIKDSYQLYRDYLDNFRINRGGR